MNMPVNKNINGIQVTARPVFKGGALPEYWVASLNNQMLLQTFPTASAVFRYARQRPHGF